jgi:hypothetical protein
MLIESILVKGDEKNSKNSIVPAPGFREAKDG